MSTDRITTLLDQLMSGTCTWQEKKELFTLIDSVEDPQLKAVLEDAWLKYNTPSHNLSDANSRVILNNILGVNKPRVFFLRRWRIAAVAAAGLLVIGLSLYKWTFSPSATPETTAIAGTDIKAPARHKATITLSNGQQVLADSITAGQLAVQGKTRVVRLASGEIVYQPEGGTDAGLLLNTLSNPQGSQITSITLSDGSRVWLNAGSSLTYPVAFSGNERKVTVKGEAYFEVASAGNHRIPFFVNIKTNQSDSSQVQVLGTHFNIKAYENEADTRVTLLQGSVQVKHQQSIIQMVPGQQAIYATGQPIHTGTPDTEQVVAWKEGLFAYQSSSIAQVLRDAARWYDIEVVYAGKVPEDTFTGNIPRTATLTELLSILQMSRVHFKLENRQLTVLN
jgi:transmembrane sensor